jgi:multimeric flavodoxin WrbA
MSATPPADYSDLRAMFVNCTLTRSPEPSHTETLIGVSRQIMEAQGVEVEVLRAIDHDIATGIYPDMTQHGIDSDEWPQIYPRILASHILVLAGPIWLGDNSSVMKRVIERLYAQSGDTNEQGQGIFYGRVGGCLITGNEDGIKHCSMNVLYSLQHVGYTIPPDADAGWIGEAGPGPSYGDDGLGFDNDFTNQNTTVATWNQLHMARMLKDAGGIPAYGNQPERWADGERFGFVGPEQ